MMSSCGWMRCHIGFWLVEITDLSVHREDDPEYRGAAASGA